MKKENAPFYKRLPYIIALFIFLPPVGIPLLFKYSSKPSRNIKIALSIVWSVMWIAMLVGAQLDNQRTYTIDNKSMTITCSSYCSYIDGYGDKEALKILASIGIKEVKTAPYTLKDNKAELIIDSPIADANRIAIEFSNNKVARIFNTAYPGVSYYSASSTDKIVAYPGTDEINASKETKQKEAAAKKQADEAAKAQKAQQEAEREAAEARVPSSDGTIELCEKYFHQQYPYNGSNVHSVLGIIANTANGADTRLYKVGVTIQNGFGAKYDAVMDCVVKKTGETITVDSFNVYK